MPKSSLTESERSERDQVAALIFKEIDGDVWKKLAEKKDEDDPEKTDVAYSLDIFKRALKMYRKNVLKESLRAGGGAGRQATDYGEKTGEIMAFAVEYWNTHKAKKTVKTEDGSETLEGVSFADLSAAVEQRWLETHGFKTWGDDKKMIGNVLKRYINSKGVRGSATSYLDEETVKEFGGKASTGKDKKKK